MTTITISGFVYSKNESWQSEPSYHFMANEDMQQFGYIMVCPHVLTFELPQDFNPIASEVSALEKKKEKLAEEYHVAASKINDRIQSLMCIGYAEEAPDGTD